MTIGGALSELNNLLNADDIPCYYKPSIKAVMDTIALSSSEKPNNSTTETLVSLGAYKQVVWERDVAIEQLHELGYEFGQKIEPTTKNKTFGSNNPLEWLGKNCKDCGNEKCKKLGTLPKGYSCALWQPESEK